MPFTAEPYDKASACAGTELSDTSGGKKVKYLQPEVEVSLTRDARSDGV